MIESDLPRLISKPSPPQNSESWRGNEKKNSPNKDIGPSIQFIAHQPGFKN